MDSLKALQISATGLEAQRIRLETVASNMANARTTRTEDGTPYVRRVPVFEASPVESFGDLLEQSMEQVRVADVVYDPSPGDRVYDPGHPDADAEGYVTFPNVDILREMVDLLDTSRTFEANGKVVDVTRGMAEQAMSIGR